MKEIKGYPNYLISENGEVINKSRQRRLRTTISSWGYERVGLYKDGKTKVFLVHRLVAEAYIPNPENLPQVNHIDMVKTNNCASNLEWCTAKYNVNYGGESSSMAKMMNSRRRPVVQILNGVVIGEFESACDAERATGIHQSNISKCCLHRKYFNSAGGYQWEFNVK